MSYRKRGAMLLAFSVAFMLLYSMRAGHVMATKISMPAAAALPFVVSIGAVLLFPGDRDETESKSGYVARLGLMAFMIPLLAFWISASLIMFWGMFRGH